MGIKRSTMRFGLVALCAVTVTAGCADRGERVLFDGVQFRTKSKATSEDRQSFLVRVPRVDRSIEGAREAGAYEAARYCIENFGTSEITWVIGPDGEAGSLVVDGNDLTLTGRCVLW